ncbi:hypothetical protein Bca4012_018286 [Brassica carinata]|uniref:VQ domain-containing protein n=1 Tax=Brassica carinata TaxID=52824 RepID=A0A8X8BF42_BRACI|nr:hypothetical protein Bca52824_003318 [Brassica carinata]
MEVTQYHQSSNKASGSRVFMNKNSKVISKIKPKIRIIHIFPPEIIKTDIKNFRSVVQSLTGKPAAGEAKTGKKRARPEIPTSQEPVRRDPQPVDRLTGLTGLSANGGNHHVKEEWGGSGDQSTSNTNTYFDLDGLIQDVGEDYFSTFPMRSSSSSQVEGFDFNNSFDRKGHNSS